MPLSAAEIAALKEEANAIHTKITALLKIQSDGGGWTSSTSLTQKDCVCYLRGLDEAKDYHSKEELPEYANVQSYFVSNFKQCIRYPWCKCESFINAPPEFVLQFIWDISSRFEYDEYAKKERCAIVQKVAYLNPVFFLLLICPSFHPFRRSTPNTTFAHSAQQYPRHCLATATSSCSDMRCKMLPPVQPRSSW